MPKYRQDPSCCSETPNRTFGDCPTQLKLIDTVRRTTDKSTKSRRASYLLQKAGGPSKLNETRNACVASTSGVSCIPRHSVLTLPFIIPLNFNQFNFKGFISDLRR
jgi:hypothetical protein